MVDRTSSLDPGYTAGDLSLFPVVKDDKETLHDVTNNAKTTLKQTLTYNSRIIVVEDTSLFPASGIVRMAHSAEGENEYELIGYTKKTANTFEELQRGFAGSTQNTWYAGQTFVTNSVIAETHNATKDAVINIQAKLGKKTLPAEESLNGILTAQETRFLAPKPLFRAYPIKGVPPLTVRFQNLSIGHIIRYLWDFGDGGTSLEKSPFHTYVEEGTYTVKLNILTSSGAQGVATKTGYITVNTDESIPFFYVSSVSNPYSVQTAAELTTAGDPTDAKEFEFVDQTDGDIVQRNWIFGDGETLTEQDADKHVATHVYSNPGEYTVTLLDVFSNGRLKKTELPVPLTVL